MRSSRRGSMRSIGLVAVAVLAVLALVLIILKFKDSSEGPGVTAVPLTAPQGQRAANATRLGDGASAAKNPSPEASGAKNAAAPVVDRDLEIQVVDSATKQPLGGVELSINMQPGGNRTDRTEEKGKAWLMLPPEDPKYMSISVKADGYVKKYITWRGDPIPATYVIALDRGTTIGGIVKDEEGNPIAGANLNLTFPGDRSANGIYISEGPIKTDAEGKWRSDRVPADFNNLSIRLDHPNFISGDEYGGTPRPADGELRAQTAVSVMKRGIVLGGIVTDEAGKPIAGASVLQGADRFGSNNPKIKTGPDGKFMFGNSRPGTVILTVTAKTYSPELKQVTVGKDSPPVEFKLSKGKVVRGKVVDVNGKALGGVMVVSDSWRGYRSLDWRTNTKTDGSFVWSDAPPDQVLIHVMKQGYQSERNTYVSAADKEWVITLLPPQKISGSVVDAQTGAAIDSFKVIPGIKWDNSPQVAWNSNYEAKAGRDGKFEIEFTEPYPQRLIKIEAAGYLPAISPPYKPSQTNEVFDAKLAKGIGPTGTIVHADGSPAAAMDVMLVSGNSGASMRNGVLDGRNSNSAITKTGTDGKFEFPPQVENFMIVASGEDGFGEATQEQLKASPQVKLVPWGRVVGKFMIGSKPGENASISLNHNRAYREKGPQFWMQYEAQTDKDGNFAIERVAPGDVQISRQVYVDMGRFRQGSFTHTAHAAVKSGETTTVQLGGTGRPVIGKVVLPKEAEGKTWTLQGGLNSKLEEPKPKEFATWTPEKQQEWYKEYYKSPEYNEFRKKQRYYNFFVSTDGTFRQEDVEPGNYGLHVSATEPSQNGWGEQVGMAQIEVTIPPITGGRTDEPLDVGTLTLTAIKRIKVGDDMSSFTTPTLDGKGFKMSDYKGKVVVLHTWNSAQENPGNEAFALKDVFDQFGKNENFVMIGLCFDPNADTGQAYVKKNAMSWPQVYVGGKSNMYQELGLQMFPTTLLVGADGKLVAKDIQRPQLNPLISAALKK